LFILDYCGYWILDLVDTPIQVGIDLI